MFKTEMLKKHQTAVDFFYDKIKSHFEHDGDLLETLNCVAAKAKEKEYEQHGRTWDSAIQAHENRGYVISRSICDFDDYEIK
jgi:hypothetical protein